MTEVTELRGWSGEVDEQGEVLVRVKYQVEGSHVATFCEQMKREGIPAWQEMGVVCVDCKMKHRVAENLYLVEAVFRRGVPT